jgi:hypothetical protein
MEAIGRVIGSGTEKGGGVGGIAKIKGAVAEAGLLGGCGLISEEGEAEQSMMWNDFRERT